MARVQRKAVKRKTAVKPARARKAAGGCPGGASLRRSARRRGAHPRLCRDERGFLEAFRHAAGIEPAACRHNTGSMPVLCLTLYKGPLVVCKAVVFLARKTTNFRVA